jgi:hypothetical protein
LRDFDVGRIKRARRLLCLVSRASWDAAKVPPRGVRQLRVLLTWVALLLAAAVVQI